MIENDSNSDTDSNENYFDSGEENSRPFQKIANKFAGSEDSNGSDSKEISLF